MGARIGKITEIEGGVEWRIENILSLKNNASYVSPSFLFAGTSWNLGIKSDSIARNKIAYIDLRLSRVDLGRTIPVEYTFSLKTRNGDKDTEIRNKRDFGSFDEGPDITFLLGSARMSELVWNGILTVVCHLSINPTEGADATQFKIELDQKAAKLDSVKKELGNERSELTQLKRENEALIRRITDIQANRDLFQNLLTSSTKNATQLKKDLEQKTAELELMKKELGNELFKLKHQYEELRVKMIDIEASRENLQSSPTSGIKSESRGSDSTVHKHRTLQNLKQLFLNQDDSDVVIRVKGREFKAHRLILKTQSPVFASTFRSDMKEKATGVVDIDDLEPSIFSHFLLFLYCEELDNLSENNVFELYRVADKYDVPELMTKCVEFMTRNLRVDTFCETTQLALLHSETELIKLCTDFFVKNAKTIIKTVKWQTFVAENPTEGNELFIKFVTSDEH